MKKAIHILCVDDVPADVVMIQHALQRGGLHFTTRRVESREAFLQEIEHHRPDVILSDHGVPSFDGFAALALARRKCPDVPFIFVTGSMGEQRAVEMFKGGATDYVVKQDLARLAPAVRRAMDKAEEQSRLKQKVVELQENEARLDLMVSSVKDYAIYMLDAEGNVATWNAGAERIKGYRAEEILGKPLAIFFTPEDIRQGIPAQVLKKAKAEGQADYVGWRVRKDGSRLWVQGIVSAIRDKTGKLCGFTKVAHDVTRHKEAEEQVRQLNTQLEQRVRERTAQLESVNRELEAFSYSISHDLRAPLRHIAGYVQLLQTDAGPRLDETSRQHLKIIADSAANLGTLIDGLLAFSYIGRAEMRQQRVDLNVLVDEARREFSREIEGRDIEWHVGELPTLWGDRLMLRQVFVNLISNAVKYTRRRRKARIEIGARESGEETAIFVRDNGVGFDMKYADRLFDVFQRLHGRDQFEGIGIGLANVRRIIRRYGGRVWAEGAVNKGATFSFSIPKLQAGKA